MTQTERDALIETLDRHRNFLLGSAEGLTEEQARTASTISELTIASLLKHVADAEEQWLDFAVRGTVALEFEIPEGEWEDTRFVLSDAETLPVLRDRIAEVGAMTTELLRTGDLDRAHPLPEAPWFEPGAVWSLRRVALHLIAEIAQHAGHADIIREAIDGRKSMG